MNKWFVATLMACSFWINPFMECLGNPSPGINRGFMVPLEWNEKMDIPFFIDPELTGPDRLCMIFGSVIGDFSGLGEPATDVYSWQIISPSNVQVFNRTGGGTFQNISFSFGQIGNYSVSLSVRRGNTVIYNATKSLSVIQGPSLILQPDYLLCGRNTVSVSVLDSNTPNLDQYTFQWKNAQGAIVGTTNTLEVSREGTYSVSLFLNNESGGADCLINGSTFVGPPNDFKLNISKTLVCLGERITVTPDVPFLGDWSVLKEGATSRVDMGTSFSLNFNTDNELGVAGLYRVFFNVSDEKHPDCASEREVLVEVKNGPKFQSNLLKNASDCEMENGAFQVTANSPLDILEIKELGSKIFDIDQNEKMLFEGLKPGIYTLEGTYNGCTRSSIIIVPNDSPPATQRFQLEKIGESCTDTGKKLGEIKVVFLDGAFEGEFRLVNQRGSIVQSGTIPNLPSLELKVSGGNFALEIVDTSGCTLPEELVFTIPGKNFVSYSVPEEINVCETFEFIPFTTDSLLFSLTFPNGEVINKNAGEAFTLTEAGSYSLMGSSLLANPDRCPRKTDFNVSLFEPIVFEEKLASQDCAGNVVYEAELFGRNPNTVSIRWLNENGSIVGRGSQFFLPAFGRYFLEVQPLESGYCPSSIHEFFVETPVFFVDVAISTEMFCPNAPSATLSVQTDLNTGDRLEWIFTDLNGKQEILKGFENNKTAEVENEGSYEAVVYNDRGCELGRDLILLMHSADDPPTLESIYYICSETKFGETIDPGAYEAYEWYFEGNLVSQSPTFKPREVGNYEIIVTNALGCSFLGKFSAFQDCVFKYVFPTGMILSDEKRHFEIFVNDPVEEAKVWIHNKFGSLVFFCENYSVVPSVSFCNWNGNENGRNVPSGTYIVTLVYRSERFGLNEKVSKSLLILD
ncbi:hypothetical protein [Rhodonellum sp.]|uniref:hypothetical protein n=1 Tax=Rhodonellum sp. TaxID=2231180 RepID=UPI0027283CA3|nr:hypothetical protein [Rhodonellum sp.]MDO9551261.1 hypothetical protein [Rhodonellum sp.]